MCTKAVEGARDAPAPAPGSKKDKWRDKIAERKERARLERENREDSREEALEHDPNRQELFGSQEQCGSQNRKGSGEIGDAMAKNKAMLNQNVEALRKRTGALEEQSDRSAAALNQGSKFASAAKSIRNKYQ